MATNVIFLPDTYGLAVCGGNSTRMGRDKSLLQYYDKPQRYHLYDMLLPFCKKAFISCNAEQAKNMEPGYLFLTDHTVYNNIGPMASLLTAFNKFPDKNILLIGCDYPFLKSKDLNEFILFCNKKNKPVSFYNKQEDLYEPLLAWYPHHCFEELKRRFDKDQYSLQHFLKDNEACAFHPVNKKNIISVDTDEAYRNAFKTINS